MASSTEPAYSPTRALKSPICQIVSPVPDEPGSRNNDNSPDIPDVALTISISTGPRKTTAVPEIKDIDQLSLGTRLLTFNFTVLRHALLSDDNPIKVYNGVSETRGSG